MNIATSFLTRCQGFKIFARRTFYRGMAVDSAPPRATGPTYYWKERVENLDKYCTGGYHPIQLNNEFCQGRYRVLHKLGHGSFSTAWLARDHLQNRYVALKVITAEASKLTLEAKIRCHLQRANPGHPGYRFILSFLDEFLIDGPNGRHLCLVSEVVGASIERIKEATRLHMLPIQTARDITPQLALGLAYMHSCGVLHGDLHSGNISFQLPNLDTWALADIYKQFGEPRISDVARVDGQPLGPEVPPYAVEPAYLRNPGGEAAPKQIKIIDFGEASFSTERRRELNTPMLLQPPEIFFGENIGLPADIWALACAIFDIFGKRALFEAFEPHPDNVLVEMISTLGKLPDRWWNKWESRNQYCHSNGVLNTDNRLCFQDEPRPLSLRVEQMRHNLRAPLKKVPEQLDTEDSTGLLNLLASMLKYEPSERATVVEVTKSAWVQQLLREFMAK